MMLLIWPIFDDKIIVTLQHQKQIQRGVILWNYPPPPIAVSVAAAPITAVVLPNNNAQEEEEISFVISDVAVVTVAATATGIDG